MKHLIEKLVKTKTFYRLESTNTLLTVLGIFLVVFAGFVYLEQRVGAALAGSLLRRPWIFPIYVTLAMLLNVLVSGKFWHLRYQLVLVKIVGSSSVKRFLHAYRWFCLFTFCKIAFALLIKLNAREEIQMTSDVGPLLLVLIYTAYTCYLTFARTAEDVRVQMQE